MEDADLIEAIYVINVLEKLEKVICSTLNMNKLFDQLMSK